MWNVKARHGLNHYLQAWQRRGWLHVIDAPCSPTLEMGEIADRVFKEGEQSPALLFRNSGTPWPVAMNLYGSQARMLDVLRAPGYAQLEERIRGIIAALTAQPDGRWQRLAAMWRNRGLMRCLPRQMRQRPPCQEVIDRAPDLSRLPILQCWPHDAGRFVTLPMVITQHPLTGQRNVGMYRMQLVDGTTTGMHWHVHKTGASHYRAYKSLGRKMPVAVALGGDPLLAYCASAPLPEGLDEWSMAGILRGSSVYLSRGVTVDLPVPAEADFVIEGFVDPLELLMQEGPFGDHTGYYSLEDEYPRFHVTCITSRRDAVYPATIVGVPPMEDAHMAKASERIFLPAMQFALAPEVRDMDLPTAGVAHNLAIASVSRVYAGQSERLANLFWGAGQMMFTKCIVTVDETVDPHSPHDVLRAIARHVHSRDRLLIGRGPLDALDHASPTPMVGGKLLVDACPSGDAIAVPDVEPTWHDWRATEALGGVALRLGDLTLLAVVPCDDGGPVQDFDTLRQTLTDTLGDTPRCIALIDSAAPYQSPYLLLWALLGNIDVEKDVNIADDKYGLTVIVDARRAQKIGHGQRWPNVVVSSKATIQRVDALWPSLGLGERVPSPSLPLQGYSLGDRATVKPNECEW